MSRNKNSVQMEDWNPEDDNKQPKPQKSTQIPKQTKPPIQQEQPPISPSDIKIDESVYDVIEGLPTGGKLYPEGTVIKARTFNVIEAKALANMNEDNADDVINQLMQKTIIGIDVEDLYTADKLYIAFWLRANTYQESGYDVKFRCPECNNDSSYAFELDALNIKELSDEDVDNIKKSFELPNGTKITYKFLTVKDEQETKNFLKKNKNSMMVFDEEILSICKMINTIDGEKKSLIEKYMYVTQKLNPSNYAYLESYLEDVSVGLEPTIEVKCNKCGGASETMLPFRPDFFLPKVQTK